MNYTLLFAFVLVGLGATMTVAPFLKNTGKISSVQQFRLHAVVFGLAVAAFGATLVRTTVVGYVMMACIFAFIILALVMFDIALTHVTYGPRRTNNTVIPIDEVTPKSSLELNEAATGID